MTGLNILIINNLAARHMEVIKNVAPNCNVITCKLEQAAEYIADVDILLPWGSMDIRPLYLAAPKLKWIHSLSAGVENLIFPEMISASTILTNSKGIHGIPVSEHVFAIMLAFTRGLNLFIRQQTEHLWNRIPVDEIHGKTLGIVGLGSIGREIAKKAKGMGMQVVASKQTMTTELFVDELFPPTQLHELLSLSDFIVIALPLTDGTKSLFKLEELSAMKPSAYLINIARGSIIHHDDLVTALQEGLIKGAGLDVFEHEPLPEVSPLWGMPNVIITPHVAALSPNYLDRAIKLFSDNLSKFLQSKEMANVIDKKKGY
jgi:D-2-hydroxyacid dehydrogenase (NADP+)